MSAPKYNKAEFDAFFEKLIADTDEVIARQVSSRHGAQRDSATAFELGSETPGGIQVSCGSTDRSAKQPLTEIPCTSPALGACLADGVPSESGTVGNTIPPAGKFSAFRQSQELANLDDLGIRLPDEQAIQKENYGKAKEVSARTVCITRGREGRGMVQRSGESGERDEGRRAANGGGLPTERDDHLGENATSQAYEQAVRMSPHPECCACLTCELKHRYEEEA